MRHRTTGRRHAILGMVGTVTVGACLMAPAVLHASAVAFQPDPSSNPGGIVLDGAGNVFTSNANDTVTKWQPTGVLAGAPWPVSVAPGSFPYRIAIDSAGNMYTANKFSDDASKIAPDGTVTPLTIGSGRRPVSIAVDSAGNVFTANFQSDNVTRIAPDGTPTVLPLVAGDDGPYGLAIDPFDNVYVANLYSSTVTKISPDGTATHLGNTGAFPFALTLDSRGNVYALNIQSQDITKISPDGVTSTMGSLGPSPYAVVIDAMGNLYIPDDAVHQVFKVTPSGTTTVLYSFATPAMPRDIAIDGSGNLYTADFQDSDVTKITDPDVAPAPPARPSAPVATAGESSATVSITPNPTDARFGTPTAYVLTAEGDPSATCTVTSPSTRCTIPGLTPGRTYRFTSVAVLDTWRTRASDPSPGVTPTGPSPAPVTPPVTPDSGGGASPTVLTATLLPSRRALRSGHQLRIGIRAVASGLVAARDATACIDLPPGFIPTETGSGTRAARKVCFGLGTVAPGAQVTRFISARAWARSPVSRTIAGTAGASGLATASAAPRTVTVVPAMPHPPVTG